MFDSDEPSSTLSLQAVVLDAGHDKTRQICAPNAGINDLAGVARIGRDGDACLSKREMVLQVHGESCLKSRNIDNCKPIV
jgi:hypothetical protein